MGARLSQLKDDARLKLAMRNSITKHFKKRIDLIQLNFESLLIEQSSAHTI